MIVKVSYFIRRLDPADLSGPVGGRRSVPVSGRRLRRRGSDTFSERPADGVRAAGGPLHPAGRRAGGDGGPGDQPPLRLSGGEAASGWES